MATIDEAQKHVPTGGGEPKQLLTLIDEAKTWTDPAERAAQLHRLGYALLQCEDEDSGEQAVGVLYEAMLAGSAHAALDLASLLLEDASSPEELALAVPLLQRATAGGLAKAAELLLLLLTPRAAAGDS